jgi:outer membrane protein TolC
MLSDRRLEAERMARRAEARLSRWLGEDAKRIPAGEPDLDKLPRIAALTTDLENHPQLAMFAPMTAAADAEAKLAAVATKPDWSVELSYGARGSAYTNMVSPCSEFRLSAGRASRCARGAKQESPRARRGGAATNRSSLGWSISTSRNPARNERRSPSPKRARKSLAAYEGGRGDLAMVLESRRLLLEARLAALNVRAEAARAWAQLAYLIPERSPK